MVNPSNSHSYHMVGQLCSSSAPNLPNNMDFHSFFAPSWPGDNKSVPPKQIYNITKQLCIKKKKQIKLHKHHYKLPGTSPTKCQNNSRAPRWRPFRSSFSRVGLASRSRRPFQECLGSFAGRRMDWLEDLQETIDVPIKYGAFRLKLSPTIDL